MKKDNKPYLTDRGKKAVTICSVLIFIAIAVAITVFLWEPVKRFGEDPGYFREWIASKGFWAPFVFVGMIVLQVVVAIIPGEPFEIGAGFAFGAFWGTVLTLIGIALGTLIIFGFVRLFGVRAVEVFFSREKINSLKFLHNKRTRNTLIIILMVIPGTPKDLISYFVPLTEIKLWQWMLISVFARIPSVITSTIGGSALGSQQYLFAGIVFGVTLVISGVGLLVYNIICKKHEKSDAISQQADENNTEK